VRIGSPGREELNRCRFYRLLDSAVLLVRIAVAFLRHTLDFIGYLQLFPDNDQQGAIVLPPVKRVNFHKTVLQCCLFAEIDMSRLRQQFQYRELQNYQNHNDTIEVSWQRKIVMVPSLTRKRRHASMPSAAHQTSAFDFCIREQVVGHRLFPVTGFLRDLHLTRQLFVAHCNQPDEPESS